jgi:hypothetical protein
MKGYRKILQWFAIIALTVYSLYVGYGNWSNLAGLSDTESVAVDFVTDWEKRMEPVKKEIPAEVTVVGYAADWDLPDVESDLIDQDNEYMLTQYTLAPIMVVPGLEPDWIVGNFTSPGFQNWLDQSMTAYTIKKFGYGIYLIHRMEP